MTAVEVMPAAQAVPENPAWHELRRTAITGSDIAAVLGISPWTSPFSLWWQKRQGWLRDDNRNMARGRRFERAVGEEFADRHPHVDCRAGGLWAHPDRPWQMTTVDLLADCPAITEFGTGRLIAPAEAMPVELKTALRVTDDWGASGSDEIPVHYRAQVLWQIDIFGATEGRLAVIFLADDEYREYVIRRDPADLHIMVTQARQFLDSLAADESPDVDTHSSTLPTVKKIHHEQVVDEPVEIPAALADAYLRGLRLAKRLAAVNARTEARLRMAMGVHKTACRDGDRVASRSLYPHHITGNTVDKLTPARRTS